MKKKLAKKGLNTAAFDDPKEMQDDDAVDEVDNRINSDDDTPDKSTSEVTLSQSASIFGERNDLIKDPPPSTSQSVTENVDDDRLSVISEISSSGSQKSPRRKRRKITDSISELKALGGRNPIPKRVTSKPISFSPPHSSHFSPFGGLSPLRQETFRSPVTARKKLKKRKSSGIMGF